MRLIKRAGGNACFSLKPATIKNHFEMLFIYLIQYDLRWSIKRIKRLVIAFQPLMTISMI